MHNSIAVLLHLVDWQYPLNQIQISPSIKVCRTKDSRVGYLYEKLCSESGIDDGEPFNFDSYVLIEPSEANLFSLDFGNPYSILDRLCNVIAIVLSQPIAMCRAIESNDDFDTCEDTHLIYTYSPQTEWILTGGLSINEQSIIEIRKAWQVSQECWEKGMSQSRIVNALTYFYYAWRSYDIEQTCINLAIVLELLFAPHSQTEISHQISFYTSRFLGQKAEDRKDIYDLVKKFYNIRSSIIHGGIPTDGKIIDITVEAFQLCTTILKRILLDENLASTFNSDYLRKEMLSKYLFE
jgi:hypothetical protein